MTRCLSDNGHLAEKTREILISTSYQLAASTLRWAAMRVILVKLWFGSLVLALAMKPEDRATFPWRWRSDSEHVAGALFLEQN